MITKRGPQKMKILLRRNVEKKFQKENEKQKKKFNWKKEKDVLKAYLHKTYPQTKLTVNRIIEQQAENTLTLISINVFSQISIKTFLRKIKKIQKYSY